MNNKVLLVDGITGSGKTTTARYLCKVLNERGIKSKWYEEEAEDNPLVYKEYDIEVLNSKEEIEKFITNYPIQLKKFIKGAKKDNYIHIIESYYLQDSIRILFQNNVCEEIIQDFFNKINNILRPLKPVLVYFRQQDVFNAIKKIWKTRGDDWKDWFIEADCKTPYVKKLYCADEEAVLTLWSDYQNFTDNLIKSIKFKSVIINNPSNNWLDTYSTIISNLELPNKYSNNTNNTILETLLPLY